MTPKSHEASKQVGQSATKERDKVYYLVPDDTLKIIDHGNLKVDNFSLLFDKMAYFENEKFFFYNGKSESPLTTNCEDQKEDSSILDVASSWLEKALTQYGIGAKTAVGNGYFMS